MSAEKIVPKEPTAEMVEAAGSRIPIRYPGPSDVRDALRAAYDAAPARSDGDVRAALQELVAANDEYEVALQQQRFCKPGAYKAVHAATVRGSNAWAAARAAIALPERGVPREPSLAMMEAGSIAADTGKLTKIWRAMYDATTALPPAGGQTEKEQMGAQEREIERLERDLAQASAALEGSMPLKNYNRDLAAAEANGWNAAIEAAAQACDDEAVRASISQGPHDTTRYMGGCENCAAAIRALRQPPGGKE